MKSVDGRRLGMDGVELGRRLVASVLVADRARFDRVLDSAGFLNNEDLRVDLSALGQLLAVYTLNWRRKLHRTLNVGERNDVLTALASGPFEDLVDPAIARDLVWLACGDPRRLPSPGSDARLATTCLLVGAALHQRVSRWWLGGWELRYDVLLKLARRHWRYDEPVRDDPRV